MHKKNTFYSPVVILRYVLRWFGLTITVAAISGSLVALFLWLLDATTQFRWQHEWLLYLLPLAGIAIHFLYKLWGGNAEKGNNLIIDEIHQPGGGVPARMAPLVILTTLITHLFGGSAGREGTAVQVGGSIAGMLARKLKLTQEDTTILLMTGIAAGFGAVFGTPVAGAVFAMEVLTRGRLKYAAALPCLMAAVLADVVCARCWGIHHTRYSITTVTPADWHQLALLALRVTVAGALFGLASLFFEKLSHAIKHYANRYIPVKWLIPAVGGLVIIGLTWLLGTTDYLGLGVNSSQAGGVSIVNAFHEHGVTHWSWLWKLVFTAITLGMGFKGGEVTPLFFIGAAVGNTLAVYMGMPADLFAGLGFIAVFAGATNTPLACTLMGFELFGAGCGPWFAVACFAAFFCSGRGSIYSAQRHSSQPSAGK